MDNSWVFQSNITDSSSIEAFEDILKAKNENHKEKVKKKKSSKIKKRGRPSKVESDESDVESNKSRKKKKQKIDRVEKVKTERVTCHQVCDVVMFLISISV